MLSNEKWFGASDTGFYNGVITRSLRLDATSSTRLESPTFSSDGGDTWTWSAWVKFHDLSKAKQILFGRSGNNACLIYNDGGTGEGELDLNDDGAVVRRSTGFFRDVSNWYHVTLNGNGTLNRLWVNGVEVNFPTTANIGKLNEAVQHQIGDSANFSGDFHADISIADVNFVSGTALDYSAFAEFKNGVLIPIEPSVTYGGNGFRLQFLQTGSSADASGIGADTSGNNNHFTAVNLDSHDVILDCPENNFCTINDQFRDVTANTIDEGGLKVTTSTSGRSFSAGTFLMTSGKWYWEFRVDANSGGMGVAKTNGTGGAGAYQSTTSTSTSTNTTDYYYGETNWAMYGDGIIHNASYVGGTASGMGSPSYPQIWGVAVDMDASPPTITYYINGSSVGSADLDTGFDYMPIAGDGSGGVSRVIHVNFGQNPTFSGTESAGTNADGNGNGLFHDAVPSGHLALCASNLPDTTISGNQNTQPDDHFDSITYTGNGTADRAIDVGFATDWFWVKQRSGSNVHQLTDTSRGALKGLNSDQSSAENTFDSVRSFTSTGVTVGTSATTNSNGSTYVAWNWLCGGLSPTKTYKVVVVSDSGNKYRFRNSADSATFAQSAVTLDLQEGGTYIFDWSDSTAQAHPIRFSLTSDGTHGGGSEYTTGVVKDDSGYKTTITVASGVATLYYYCQNHSGMGGQINTNTTHGSTNFDGSILSVSQTNETAGFSILTYTGTGSNGTIGHGLGKVPKWILIKDRDASRNWIVYHAENTAAPETEYLHLNTTDGTQDSAIFFNDTAPTSSVISLGTGNNVNNSGNDMVAFVFAEIEGYSKFGAYFGNSSEDGSYIMTNFKPAMVIFKATHADSWVIADNKRNSINVVNGQLFPDLSNAESTSNNICDFYSNGFKLRRNAGSINQNTYIYIAFAEQPFYLSNAR